MNLNYLIGIYIIISIIFSGFFFYADSKFEEKSNFFVKIYAGFIWPIFLVFAFFKLIFKNK
jgi:hypothetical protein